MAETQTQTVEEWDAQGNPIKPAPQSTLQEWDEQGNPVVPGGMDRDKAAYSLVASHMLSLPPSVAYQNHDFIKDEISKHSGGTVDGSVPSIVDDLKQGMKSSIFGLAYRNKMPDSLQNASEFDDFVSGLSETIADLPFYLFGGVAGAVAGSEIPGVGNVAGAAMGAFAVPAAMRKSYTLAIQKGEITSFGDLMERTLETTYEGAKGMLLGRVFGLAGKATAPLGRALGPAANVVEPALKMAQGSAAVAVLSMAMEGHIPTAADFGRSAAAGALLGLITHGVSEAIPDTKQGLLDVYAKDGITPKESEVKLQAQPPVQHGQTEGLQPAIKLSDGQHITGEGETHSDLAERVLGERPATVDELEGEDGLLPPGEPRTLADKVLANPKVHEQSVIDRANEIQEASASLGAPSEGGEPPVSEGMTRLYHGSAEHGRYEGKAWFSTNREYAKNYRKGAELQYVDVLTEKVNALADPEGYGQTPDKGFQFNVELDSSETGPRKSASLGAPSDIAPLRNQKSGRGFATSDGKYLNRSQAKAWVKDNEPDVYDMWAQVTGDEKAEMHSEDYQEARKRVADRNLMSGEPRLTALGRLQDFLAKNRPKLNEIKATDNGARYGNEVLRNTYAGPENMVRAQAEQVAGKIEKLIPNSVDQEAMSFMRDYRDEPDVLRADIEKVRQGTNEDLKKFIPAMERALAAVENGSEPTPEVLKADALLTDYFNDTNEIRKFTGKSSSIDPSRYSPRNFMFAEDEESERAAGGSGAKFSTRSPHDIRREYLHVLDPLQSGEVKARTFNIVDELRVYGDRLAKSTAASVFQMELENTELGKAGNRVYTDADGNRVERYPSNWVEMPGTGRTRLITDPETGESIQVRQALHVPQFVADAMRPVLEGNALSSAKWWNYARLAQSFVKSFQVGLSPFHLRAMAISNMNNANLDAFWKAKDMQMASPEFEGQEQKLALYGMTTSKTSIPYEAYQGLKPSSLTRGNALVELAKSGYAPVDATLKAVTEATFGKAQRFFKVVDASGREARWLANHPNATEAEYGDAMRSIAKQANAVYGGLNWAVMGVSKSHLNIARMILLAPDWTFSNLANLKYAVTEPTTPAGIASNLFLLRSFSTGYAMTQGMSLMLTGQQSKHWNQVYFGKDDKGKEMYSTMFFAGLPKDAITLYNRGAADGYPMGPINFAANKLGPIAGTLDRLHANKDYRGKPIVGRREDALTKSIKATEFGVSNLLPAPFQWKDLATDMLDPKSDITYTDFVVGVLAGSPVIHETPKAGKSSSKGFHLAGAKR